MNYKEKLKDIINSNKTPFVDINTLLKYFPELKESEDEKVKKEIKQFIRSRGMQLAQSKVESWIAWLEKQGECEFDCPQNHQDVNRPNGCIVLEDFNGGEGFYKVHLDYLNKKQVEEIEEMIRVWNKELKTPNENIKDCIGICLTDADEQRFKDFNTNLKECLVWLEKQGNKDMGISNTTKQKLKDNLDNALEKETPESWNEFLEKQGEQKSAEWSEKDEDTLHCIIDALDSLDIRTNTNGEHEDHTEEIYWLKSIKDRVQPQPKQEWSEEEIESCAREAEDNNCIILAKHIRQLKSLRPQSTWKPCDYELEVLRLAAEKDGTCLMGLYEQLKKLREE